MNRLLLGILCGIAFGVIDVLMTVYGNHPEMTSAILLQAFSSRFAIGLLAVNVSLKMNRAFAGALTGLLISLPDAFALHTFAGVLGTGVVFGGVAGWLSEKWGGLVDATCDYDFSSSR